MKASSITDQHLNFALALLEQPALSTLRGEGPASAFAATLDISQKALLHSSLVQSELAVRSLLVELYGFQSISVDKIDRYFRDRLYCTMALGDSLDLLEATLKQANIQIAGFVEMFTLHKDENSWFFHLEETLRSMAHTKAEWRDRGSQRLAHSDVSPNIDASSLIASSAMIGARSEARHWSEQNPNDLRSCLINLRTWARSVRSNMDEY